MLSTAFQILMRFGYHNLLITSVSLNLTEFADIKVYPNPVGVGKPLTIEFEHSNRDYSLRIFDTNGKLVMNIDRYNNDLIRFDKKGVYVISIKGDGNVPVKEFKISVN
jgi:hypothetical protein